MHGGERLEYILNVIAKDPHVTREQVGEKLLLIDQESGIVRGRESEQRTKRALEGLEFIDDIRITKPYSAEDRDEKDLVITLFGNKQVYAQVKSSFLAVSNYIDARGEIKLVSKKYVVLNGQLATGLIREDFITQVVIIDNYLRSLNLDPVLTDEIRKNIKRKLES